VLSWPTSVGALVTYCVPEIWSVGGQSVVALLRRTIAPQDLAARLEAEGLMPSEEEARNRAVADEYLARAAAFLIRAHRPAMVFLHLIDTDFAQHRAGRDGAAVFEAVRHADRLVGTVMEAVEAAGIADSTLFVIGGEHGFCDVQREIWINALLREHGWIEASGEQIRSWRAVAWKGGAQAGIYLRDPADADAVRRLLEEHRIVNGTEIYRILDREELDRLGYDPQAAFAVCARPGFTMGRSLGGPFIAESANFRGDHGYLPDAPGIATGLILWGAGVREGGRIEQARLWDIAPTIAAALGLDLPDAEGRVLEELLAPSC
jgi:predicted AlkP superfamily pyrophosphatase or phosphodiesterase